MDKNCNINIQQKVLPQTEKRPLLTSFVVTMSAETSTCLASLTCIKPLNDTHQEEWQQVLSKIDSDIMNIDCYYYPHLPSTEVIVISLPYSLQDIHKTIELSISQSLPKNCFQVITDFMIPNKKFI